MFISLEKMLIEIKNTLLNSTILRKTLFYSDKTALSKEAPEVEEVENMVRLDPVIFVESLTDELETNALINIGIVEGELYSGSVETAVKILIMVDRRIWFLEDDKIRVFQMAEEVRKLVDGLKTSAAGKLELKLFKEVYYNSNLIGFALLFDVYAEDDIVDEF